MFFLAPPVTGYLEGGLARVIVSQNIPPPREIKVIVSNSSLRVAAEIQVLWSKSTLGNAVIQLRPKFQVLIQDEFEFLVLVI